MVKYRDIKSHFGQDFSNFGLIDPIKVIMIEFFLTMQKRI